MNENSRRHFIKTLGIGTAALAVGNKVFGSAAVKNGHILDDKQAMKLWNSEYEKGWAVKG
jgi:hypothetical protein